LLHMMATLVAVSLVMDLAGAQISGGAGGGRVRAGGAGGSGGYGGCPSGGGSRFIGGLQYGRGSFAQPGAGATTPAGSGRAVPMGGAPSLPGPATGRPQVLPPGPLRNPFTLGGQEIEDLTDWRMWWELNRDVYLRLGERGARPATDGGDFFLGTGQRLIDHDLGRASRADVKARIVPALTTVIRSGAEYNLLRETIVARAKASRREPFSGLQTSLRWFISENDHPLINQTAAVAFGIMAEEDGVGELCELLADTAAGRELVGDEFVDPVLRAFAAYGLGLVGQAAENDGVRHTIVRALVEIFEDPEVTPELRSAVVLALSLVPLDPAPEAAFLCLCGECEVGGPASSLEAQVTWLMRAFMERRGLSDMVRAQTATSLARLISNRPSEVDPFLKEGVTEILVRALNRDQRQPEVVKESAALALGMIGDADLDPVDSWIRWALDRSARTGKPLERRFALIGLGLVASRPGQGEEPFAGTEEARARLLHHMTNGRRATRPWAGLALGVMGHWLLFNREELSPSAGVALKTAVRNCRKVADLGAYGLALGLRRDGAMQALLLDKLGRTRDSAARAYVALALGLIGDRSAIEPLREIVTAERTQPELREQCGLALGLLSDDGLAPLLLAELEERRDSGSCGALAVALGSLGDRRSIEALTTMFQDVELDDGARASAAVALGRLADATPLTWRSLLATGTNYHGAPASLTNPGGTGVLDLH